MFRRSHFDETHSVAAFLPFFFVRFDLDRDQIADLIALPGRAKPCCEQVQQPTLATKRTLLLDLGRTFTGWIAPAFGWRTYSIISSASDGADAEPPLSVAGMRSLKPDLGSLDWYTGNSK